jgi:hypothetical protein
MPPEIASCRLSRSRALVGDVALLARDIPLFPVERALRLDAVAAARAAHRTRVGWAAIFTKAYALVARELPTLRTWLAGGLGPRLVTAAESVATLAVNRVVDGEERLFWGRLHAPETLPLVAIQRFIDDCRDRPISEVFPRQLELERTPGFLRRAVLRWNMRSATAKRATRLGTFSLSTLAGSGAVNRFHPTLCTTSLSYGPLEADGRCLVTLIADHRVIDGAAAARALEWLEQALRLDIVPELAAGAAHASPEPAEPVPAELRVAA